MDKYEMEIIIIIILLIFSVIYLLVKDAKIGIPNSICDLETPLRNLLKRGYNGGFLVITHKPTKRFIQFSKYIRKKDVYGIQFNFPIVDWSEPYIDPLKKLCSDMELSYSIEKSTSEDGIDFIDLDFKMDVILASRFSKNVLSEVFGISENQKVFVLLDNASFNNELIDSDITSERV